jgi:hypothetical protein
MVEFVFIAGVADTDAAPSVVNIFAGLRTNSIKLNTIIRG